MIKKLAIFAIILLFTGCSNVTFYDPKKVYPGYNLYENKLTNLQGKDLHTFGNKSFKLVTITTDGTYLAKTAKGFGRFYPNDNPIWKQEIQIHHDLSETTDGTIVTIGSEITEYKNRTVKFDIIYEFLGDGTKIYSWSTYDNLEYIQKFHKPTRIDNPDLPITCPYINQNKKYCDDYYHINSVQSIPEDFHNDSRFRRGNLLVSLTFVDLVIILDKNSNEIVWSYGEDEISHQHMPRFLDNGNIIIFDNAKHRNVGFSRVIELNPLNKEIVWEYRAENPYEFYTPTKGSAQYLPNNNILITESDSKRVFEVDKNGSMVWEWKNVTNSRLYRMMRIKSDSAIMYLD